MIISALDALDATMTHKSRYNLLYKINCVVIWYHDKLTCEDVNAVDMSEVAPIHCNGDDLVWIKISWGRWK